MEEFGPELLLALRLMAATGSRVCAISNVEGNNGRERWHPNMGNPKKTEVNSSHGGLWEMRPGEHCFTIKNSTAKHRALFKLKKELESTLLFEHGGEYKANPH